MRCHLDNPLERSVGGGLEPLNAVIEVAKFACPNEWSRYCDLAHQLVQTGEATEISREEAGRQLLAADGKHGAHTLASLTAQASGYRQLTGFGRPPKTELEIAVEETNELEDLFRNRLLEALQSRRYLLKAFDRLEQRTLSPALIKPEHFRFGSDEMELNEIKLAGVHFVRAQAIAASQNDPPGRKPGQNSSKDLACDIVLSILNDEARRPPKRHGRLVALARMVQKVLHKEGKTYVVDSIEKFIRGTVRVWEDANPDE